MERPAEGRKRRGHTTHETGNQAAAPSLDFTATDANLRQEHEGGQGRQRAWGGGAL